MSEEQGSAAAVAEPVAAPSEQPQVAEQPAQETQESTPKTRKALRQAAVELGRSKGAEREARDREVAEAVKNQALSDKARAQPRDDKNQRFVKAGEEETPEGAAEAAPEEAQEGAAAEVASPGDSEKAVEAPDAAQAAPASQTVTIPIPDGHPLRDQGLKELSDIPAEQERAVRTALNAAARSREVEEAERRNAILEARLKALSTEMPAQYQNDPRFQQLLNQIEEAPGFGPEMRQLVEQGFLALNNQHVQSLEQEATAQLEMRSKARAFSDSVFAQAPKILTAWSEGGELQARLPSLMHEYGSALDEHNANLRPGQQPIHPDPAHFFKWMGGVYRQDPRVRARLEDMKKRDAAAERERIRQEVLAERAKEEEEKRAEANARHGARPPIGSTVSTSAPPSAADPASATTDAVRQPNRRKLLREQARQIGERYAR